MDDIAAYYAMKTGMWKSLILCPKCKNYQMATDGKFLWCVQRGCDYGQESKFYRGKDGKTKRR